MHRYDFENWSDDLRHMIVVLRPSEFAGVVERRRNCEDDYFNQISKSTRSLPQPPTDPGACNHL